jgi:4a-hydroxytetrahydrobiopterin dehydratase
MTNPWTDKKCVPCEGGLHPLNRDKALQFLKDLSRWHLSNDAKTIYTDFNTNNFLGAVALIQKIAQVAEAENHHPDLHLTGYKKLRVELSTHAIKGLSENDFILASKISEIA